MCPVPVVTCIRTACRSSPVRPIRRRRVTSSEAGAASASVVFHAAGTLPAMRIRSPGLRSVWVKYRAGDCDTPSPLPERPGSKICWFCFPRKYTCIGPLSSIVHCVSRSASSASQPMAYCPRPLVERFLSSSAEFTASAAARSAEVSGPEDWWNRSAANPANWAYSLTEKLALPVSSSCSARRSCSRPHRAGCMYFFA